MGPQALAPVLEDGAESTSAGAIADEPFRVAQFLVVGIDRDGRKYTPTMGKDARPGGTASTVRTMTATIADIDKSTSSMTFVGPNGWKYSRRVVDPNVFDQVKAGDKVDITWSTDVNFAVQ